MTTPTQTPGIEPADVKMTMAQCDAEIKALDQIHRTAILDFCRALKGAGKNPLSSWSPIQKDLHTLFRNKVGHLKGLDAPGQPDVGAIWDRLISRFDDGIKERLQMSPWASLGIAAVDTSDGELTLVHRYEGEDIYSVAEDALEKVPEGTGPHWYYRSYSFESDDSSRGSYCTPYLYVIGTIDPESGQWAPKAVKEFTPEYYQLIERVEVMETLVECCKIPAWKEAPLPTFPSGVEARLKELQLLRILMSRQATTSTPDEKAAIAAAGAPFAKPIADLQLQIQVLTDTLEQQQQLKAKAEAQAQLNALGFEFGQVVTHASSGETGVLALTGGRWPRIFVEIEGKEKPGSINQNEVVYAMRCGEWSLATQSQGHGDEAAATPERNRG